MASIRDFLFSAQETSSTSFTGALPVHEVDDLLVFFATKNTTGGGTFGTPSGWTALALADETSPGAIHGVFWKIATSTSETDPVTTTTAANTWSGFCVSVSGADTADPIQGFVDVNLVNRRLQAGVLATDENDTLLVYYCGGDQTRQQLAEPSVEPIMLLDSGQSVGVSSALGWSFRQESGEAAPQPYFYRERNDDIIIVTLAINDDGTGDIPGYHSSESVGVSMVHPLMGTQTDTHWGGTFSAGVGNVLIIDGVTTEALNTFNTLTGAGIFPVVQVIRAQSSGNTNWKLGQVNFDSAVDLSGEIITFTMKATAGSDVSRLPTVGNGGIVFGIEDSSGNYKLWQVGASNSVPNDLAHIPIVIDVDNATATPQAAQLIPAISLGFISAYNGGYSR